MNAPRKLLCELIALPSVNPAFLVKDDPGGGERQVAEFLAATAAKAGLDIEFQPVLPGRANLLARCLPRGRVRHRVLLAPHLDTVGGGSADHFTPRLVGGRLYGRGACDTKGSVAAMLSALIALVESKRRPPATEVVFAGLVDEEDAQAGSRALAASGLCADLAVVGEPTGLKVVTAHKGDLWLEIETRGRAAHGSRPELGKSAIVAMATVVRALEGDYAADLRRRRHGLLGSPTVNVGTILGGVQPNIVPDRCQIRVDRRTIPGETEAGVRREIRRMLRRVGATARVANLPHGPCPPLETDHRQPMVQLLLRAADQTGPAGADYFCDAAILAAGGMPSVVFGPGNIAQAHTADEWISLRQVDGATARLRRFLESLP